MSVHCRSRISWVLALSVVVSCLAGRAFAAQTITTVEVAGNRTVGADAIRSHVRGGGVGSISAAQIDEALKSLYATGLFADVRIDRRGAKLLISVKENPVIARIGFQGNVNADKSKLEPLLGLKAQARYTAAKAHADALKVRDFYRSQGRLTTEVEAKLSTRPDGQVEVTFAVTEGDVTKIDNIVFVGNRTFTDGQLRDVITTSQSGWFDILKTAAFYDPERIKQDRDLLRQFYLKNGFPDVRVVTADAVKNEQGSGYSISFTIEEGERYTFGPTSIQSSIGKVDTASLQSTVTIKPGSTYSVEQVEKSVEQMTLNLSDQGHPSANVRMLPKRDEASRTISMAIEVQEGTPIYVERIEVVGNAQTKDFVIRRELRFTEGDRVNAFILERARKRIQALGFFKKVTLKKKTGSSHDRVVVTVEVIEGDTRNLAFGAGYSTSEGIVGDISVTERNLLGNGQALRVKLTGSAMRLQAELGFTEPRLLGSNFAGGFDLFYKDTDYTTQSSFKSQKAGASLRLGYQITDEWSGGVNYTFARNTIYDVGANASAAIKEAVPGFPNISSNTYDTSSAGYALTYDTRNNKRRPTEGVYFTLAQDLAGVGGDVRYLRSVGEARGYYAISETVTAAGRATGGVIGGWGGQDVRLLDLFYRGSESVRGFAFSGIGPRDTLSANRDALGGRMYFATTAEVLFQIPGVPQDFGLRGAVFADVGSLWGVNKTAAALPGLAGNALTPRASVGMGLAWDSPIGALRADYAYPIIKQPFDKTQAFSFGLSPF
jgi:outer membrane protein insertion porin family